SWGRYSKKARSTRRRIEAISTTEWRLPSPVREGRSRERRAASAPSGSATSAATSTGSQAPPALPRGRSALGGIGMREVEAGEALGGLASLEGEPVVLLEFVPSGPGLVPLLLLLEQAGLAVEPLGLGAGLRERGEGRDRRLDLPLRLEREGLALQGEDAAVVLLGAGEVGVVERDGV